MSDGARPVGLANGRFTLDCAGASQSPGAIDAATIASPFERSKPTTLTLIQPPNGTLVSLPVIGVTSTDVSEIVASASASADQ